jgi:hypothetical protein
MPSLPHFPTGGTHWETAALRNALAYSGVIAPHTGKPLTEPMCLGIAGGIAAGYSFCPSIPRWEAKLGPPPALTPDSSFEDRYIRLFRGGSGVAIVARHHAFSTGADKYELPLRRLGCKTAVKETTSAKAAHQHLLDGLAAGRPVLLWTAAPRLSIPAGSGPCGMYSTVCFGIDEAKREASLADRGVGPIVLALDELAFLRNRVCSFKNRSLTFEPPANLNEKTFKNAVSQGLAACAADFAKPKLGTYNLPGMLEWSKVVASPRNKKGWPAVYPGGRLYLPLRDVFDSIETSGTGGGLMRGLYADFLDEAADLLSKPALKRTANTYRNLADRWTDIAEACLPDSIKPFRRAKSLLRKRNELAAAGGPKAREQIAAASLGLSEIEDDMRKAFPLDAAQTKELLEGIAAMVASLHSAETQAAKLLS